MIKKQQSSTDIHPLRVWKEIKLLKQFISHTNRKYSKLCACMLFETNNLKENDNRLHGGISHNKNCKECTGIKFKDQLS